MPITPSISNAGAFYRSDSGVKCNYDPAPAVKYYYFSTPIVETVLNLSDFTSWRNSGLTKTYALDSAVYYPMYNGMTGAFIGNVTKKCACTPRMNLVDSMGDGLSVLHPSYVCTNSLVVDGNSLAQNYLKTDTSPIYYGGRSVFISSSSGNERHNAIGRAALLPTKYYEWPISGVMIYMHLSGVNFYPHKIRVVIDENIDDWYEGKFTDDPWTTTGGVIYTLTPTRNATTMLDSTGALSGGYAFNLSSDGCYYPNTRVTLVDYPL